jgi:hypothetical protein
VRSTGDRKNYWGESIGVDPANFCPERGEYPHVFGCDVSMYELDPNGDVSHLFGACHEHRTYWHLQSGGRPDPEWEALYEHAEGYTDID